MARISLRQANLLVGLMLIIVFAAVVAAQPDLQPPPENLKVAMQPDCPLQITFNQMRVDPKLGQSLSYSVRNVGTTPIIGFVVDGMPGSMTQRAIPLEAPLLPGMARSFGIFLYPQKEVTGEYLAKIDFVLRQDGSTWGTRSTGDADFVVNFFDGLKRVIADSKTLVAEGDDAKLAKFINSAPDFPENAGDIRNWTRKQEGFMRGYGVGLFSFRDSIKVRGDLKGIPGRIADLERGLDPNTAKAGDPKRISMSPSYFEDPIKILNVSIGKEPVSFDQDMPARPDWLKGLAFKIKNTSGKTIKRVSIDLDFPETMASGNMIRWSLLYGQPVYSSLPNNWPNETAIAPDAIVDINLSEKEFEGLKKTLASRQGLDATTQVNVVIGSIFFNDGTAWKIGQLMKQDPEDPRRWTPIK